jgi:hypothetical protein
VHMSLHVRPGASAECPNSRSPDDTKGQVSFSVLSSAVRCVLSIHPSSWVLVAKPQASLGRPHSGLFKFLNRRPVSMIQWLLFFFFFAALRFKLRAYTLNHSTSLTFVMGFFEIRSQELFVCLFFYTTKTWKQAGCRWLMIEILSTS